MRILAPYCSLNTRVLQALDWYADAEDVEYVYTGKTRTAYWEAIAERWQGLEDLVIVEQDIEIHEGVMAEFASCPEPWCVFWYMGGPTEDPYGTPLTKCLGCTKFAASLQVKVPHSTICEFPEQQSWDTIDGRISRMLLMRGYAPHQHGQVRHHHKYEVTFLPSPSNLWRRYTWRNVGKGEYPTVAGNEALVAPDDAERHTIDCSRLENEAE